MHECHFCKRKIGRNPKCDRDRKNKLKKNLEKEMTKKDKRGIKVQIKIG